MARRLSRSLHTLREGYRLGGRTRHKHHDMSAKAAI